jgi:hypothetical protein
VGDDPEQRPASAGSDVTLIFGATCTEVAIIVMIYVAVERLLVVHRLCFLLVEAALPTQHVGDDAYEQ